MKEGNISKYNDGKWHELTITITITREQITTLGGWASVSRTFDGVKRCMDSDVSEDTKSRVAEEVAALHAPLSNLHGLVRQEIWKEWGPFIDQISSDYKDEKISFEIACQELVKLGVWNWKAKEWMREIDKWMEALPAASERELQLYLYNHETEAVKAYCERTQRNTTDGTLAVKLAFRKHCQSKKPGTIAPNHSPPELRDEERLA